jgi:hypothetical protein
MTAAGQTSQPRFSLADIYALLLGDIRRTRAARLAREQADDAPRRDDAPPGTSGESAQQAADCD